MNELRPVKLADMVGQHRIKQCLKISIKAAQVKHKALPHLLVEGPPGIGKTTIALAIANEMNSPIQIANGANLRNIKKVLPYLTRTKHRSILFVDEIHRMTKLVDEFLYPVLEDFRIDLENEGETIPINLEPFTFIGATTDAGILSAPLYDRFELKHHLQLYSTKDIQELVSLNSNKLEIILSEDVKLEIAKRSRGTPRIANNLLKWTNDYSIAKKCNITLEILKEALTLLGIDEYGFDSQDRKYLSVLNKNFPEPIGLETIVAQSNINRETILHQIEPFLLKQGIIKKTGKGRILVRKINFI